MDTFKNNNITLQIALNKLREGNKRFLDNKLSKKDFQQQIKETSDAQSPFACVLSCIDSRTTPEIIFDQGIGDIFSVRIAGNIVNDDILGSLEYACCESDSKLILVLGHTKCGAITSACNGFTSGHITGLLEKIKPSIEIIKQKLRENSVINSVFIDKVSEHNVANTINQIRSESRRFS
jgi:carbonic anhydrase